MVCGIHNCENGISIFNDFIIEKSNRKVKWYSKNVLKIDKN